MTTVEVTSPRLRRNQIIAWAVKAVAVGIVAALLVVSYVSLLVALRDLTQQQREAACGRQLLAYTFLDVAKAFKAPLSPNGPRDAAVTDINRSADRYAHAVNVCARDLTPARLPPTPVPTTQGVTP